MKKRLFALFLVVVMASVTVTACGKSKDKSSSKDKEGEETAEEVEKNVYKFTIWGSKGDISEKRGNWLKTRCDMFAAKYPDDEVEFEFATYTEDKAAEKMEKNREDAPDIYIFKSAQTDKLVESRLLTRLWGETAEYVVSSNTTSIGNLSKYQDKVYGIPIWANPYVLYYDKRVLSEEDVQNLDTILAKGVLSYPLENEKYLEAFYGAQDIVEIPKEESADGTEAAETEEGEEVPEGETPQDGASASTEEETPDEEVSEPIAKERVDAWLDNFKRKSNVVNDADGSVGVTGLKNGTIQAAVRDAEAYRQMKEALGDNLGAAALPVFTIDGMQKQMKCVAETRNIGVNPDCENFEMTIALATYLGSADSQQMHYDMSGVIPVNLTAVQTLREIQLADVIAQIADKENPGWDVPEEEEEEE